MNTNTIFLQDLKNLQSRLGLSQNFRGADVSQPVMAGHFQYLAFQSGLSMHVMDAVEHQNTESTMELPEGLSFNFMFSGQINFSFANEKHIIGPDQGRICCSAIINNSSDILTRSMCAGMHIKKVNVFVERQWLENRCKTSNDSELLNHLFTDKRVLHWLPDEEVVAKASQLFTVNQSKGFSGQLEAEFLTMQLLSGCIDQLHQDLNALDEHSDQQSKVAAGNPSLELKHAIDQLLERHDCLHDIATALNMSERTLQRRFQSCFQQTLSAYVRQRRLEKAKCALAIEGRSIGEAAYIAGYNHSSNFVNAFKKHYGMTPSEFLKVHQGVRH
ncbi:response regulator transcription factor [Litoribrevibacter albus]|uniref:AraC family transcriptional regulator n=1 Tax=Litoribrevibacter albus TaxID=1473156 RepID=A0AA37W5P0_9GAMM|nr:response regulator transcription factor [Litoribrevibacter albus]GLQ29578.1 AraC family transcriptional regulator [Litoribrevibacter albus]